MSEAIARIPEARTSPENVRPRRAAWRSKARIVTSTSAADAVRALQNRSTELEYAPPCTSDPRRWDSSVDDIRETGRRTAERVSFAVGECRSCLVRFECDMVRRTASAPDGVYAGRYYDSDNGLHQEETRAALAKMADEIGADK